MGKKRVKESWAGGGVGCTSSTPALGSHPPADHSQLHASLSAPFPRGLRGPTQGQRPLRPGKLQVLCLHRDPVHSSDSLSEPPGGSVYQSEPPGVSAYQNHRVGQPIRTGGSAYQNHWVGRPTAPEDRPISEEQRLRLEVPLSPGHLPSCWHWRSWAKGFWVLRTGSPQG